MQDLAEDLISPVTAREIYQVAFDQQTRVLDREETARQRDAERQARLARGQPYDQFVQQWQTRSEEQQSELQSLMRISYDVLCLKQQNQQNKSITQRTQQ